MVIYCINLLRRRDRKFVMERIWPLRQPIKFLDAVDAAEYKTSTMMAVRLSKVMALDRFLETKEEHLLFLEDDCKFDSGFEEDVQAFADRKDYDLAFLGGQCAPPTLDNHAVMFTREGAKKTLRLFAQEDDDNRYCDNIICEASKSGQLNSVWTGRYTAHQRSSASDNCFTRTGDWNHAFLSDDACWVIHAAIRPCDNVQDLVGIDLVKMARGAANRQDAPVDVAIINSEETFRALGAIKPGGLIISIDYEIPRACPYVALGRVIVYRHAVSALLSLGGERLIPCLNRLQRLGIRPRVHAGLICKPVWLGFSRAYLRMLLDYELTGVLALEDDVVMDRADYDVPDDADMVYLGATLHSPSVKYTATLSVLGEMGAWTTHAVHWTPSGIKKLSDNYDESIVLDDWVKINRSLFVAYICDPMLATQQPCRSDIQSKFKDYEIIYESQIKYGINNSA